MNRLTGKVALVTGASRGIGKGIARNLSAEGATVVVNYAKSREAADRTIEEIVNAGGQAWAVQGDFSKPEEITRTFENIEKQARQARCSCEQCRRRWLRSAGADYSR